MSRTQNLRDILKIDLFLYYFLIPIWVLIFYFISFSRLLPEGVNKVFVTKSGKYAFLSAIFLSIVFFVFIKIRGIALSKKKPGRKLYAGDITLLLLPLTPVTQYIINNLEILSFIEVINIFFVCAFFISVFVFFVPFLLKKVGSTRTMMFLGLAFMFTIADMADLSRQFTWHIHGSLKIQLLVFCSVFLLSWFLFHLNYRKFLYLLVAALFLTTTASQFLTRNHTPYYEPSKPNLNEIDNKLITLIDSKEPSITPNIYLLVYDAYVVNETMLVHGINNQPQEQYLEETGFQLYPYTYSLGAWSAGSMSRVLNASVDYYGVERKAASGNGVVQYLLKGFNYKTYGVFPSDYFFRGIEPSYDYFFPGHSESPNIILKGILIGEFRFDIGFEEIPHEQFVREKLKLFSESLETPKFIYTHSHYPSHSQNSGTCLPNEVDLYKEKLLKANIQMKQDVETIIENDPEAIVIVAGDHGPSLTKNCAYTKSGGYDLSEISRLDIQDRYGAFLAIRWPTQDFEKYDDIVVLQDIFPAIFAYIFQNPKLLESKVEPVTLDTEKVISGAMVVDGIIEGGIHSGEPLFISGNE